MRLEEFGDFERELKQLCASLGKPYTAPLGQAYWRVLQDIPLSELEANVERILLNATGDTKFPRPQSLRTTPPKRSPVSLESDPTLKDALARNKRNLDEMLERSPVEARWHILGGYLARVDAEEEWGSTFHNERISWAREAAKRLFKKHGQSWCVQNPHNMHTASRLLGGEVISVNYKLGDEKF